MKMKTKRKLCLLILFLYLLVLLQITVWRNGQFQWLSGGSVNLSLFRGIRPVAEKPPVLAKHLSFCGKLDMVCSSGISSSQADNLPMVSYFFGAACCCPC